MTLDQARIAANDFKEYAMSQFGLLANVAVIETERGFTIWPVEDFEQSDTNRLIEVI